MRNTPSIVDMNTVMPAAKDDITDTIPSNDWLVPNVVAVCIAGVGLTAAITFAFWDFFAMQWHWATTQSADWGHTLFIPIIALYIAGLHRAELFEKPFRNGLAGIWLIVFGLACYALTTIGPESTVLNSHNARSIGVGITIFGICAVLFGWRSLVWLWFPIIYALVFGQRITDKLLIHITYPLQDAAAVLGYFLLSFWYQQIELVGTSIVITENGISSPLDVAEACSGMRMLMAFLALGSVIAYVGLDRWWLRLLLVSLGIPIAIVINGFRIATLGVLSMQGQEYIIGQFHSMVGLLWMIPTFGLYMLMLWFLAPLGEGNDGESIGGVGSSEHREVNTPRFDPRATKLLILVICMLAIGGYGLRSGMALLDRHLIKDSVPPRMALNTIPSQIGEWTQYGEDVIFSDTLVEVLGTNRYLDRSYALNNDPNQGFIHLHIAYYTDLAGASPHVPERCWEVHGGTQVRRPEVIGLEIDESQWRETAVTNRNTRTPYFVQDSIDPLLGTPIEIPMPLGEIGLRTTQFTTQKNPNYHRLGGYLFLANGRVTNSARTVENLAFDITSSHAYYCKVQIDMSGSVFDDGTKLRNRYKEQSENFMNELLPDLMQVLPDWRDYEFTDSQD